jgi:transcriptional regulator GlxA family with amidase domain
MFTRVFDFERKKIDIFRMSLAAISSDPVTGKSPLRVVVVLLPESSIMSLACVLDPMRAANRAAARRLFDWTIKSPKGEPALLTAGISIPVEGAFTGQESGDLLVVIGGFNLDRHAGRGFTMRLQSAARRFSCVAGIESGCWLLARSGLVNDRAATAHWEELEDFAAMFPDVRVRADRFVAEGKFWTSGGASPTFDMMLHLTRQHFGAAVALDVASIFVYDETHAPTDAQPVISLGRMQRQSPELSEALRLMEKTIERPLSLHAISRKLGYSRRKLDQLFLRGLETAPGRYYLRLRLQAAQRLVVDTDLPVSEIALRSGFESLSAFSRSFRNEYGRSPLKMRQTKMRVPRDGRAAW